MNDFKDSKLKYIIIILLGQSFFLLALAVMVQIKVVENWNEILLNIVLFVAVALSILAIILIKDLFKLIKYEMDFKLQELRLEEKQKLIKSLKIQKHDFLNHLQLIYGMVQLDKKEEIKDYISSLNDELSVLKVDDRSYQTVYDIMLYSKSEQAKKDGIKLNYQLDSSIEKLAIAHNKLSSILSNLVDNAVDATKGSRERLVKIKGEAKEDSYCLSVYNTGSVIKEDLLEKIFEPGFSTKKDDRGFGLHIIKVLIESEGGKIEVISQENYGTEFICHLPKP